MELSVLDGGMGMELFKIGVPNDRQIWSARALVESKYHSKVVQAHYNFLEAGARYITTNNYAVVPGYLKKVDLWHRFEELTTKAGELASQAVTKWVTQTRATNKPQILGSIPPLSESYQLNVGSAQEQQEIYRVMIECLMPFIDVFLLETVSHRENAQNALAYVLPTTKPYWLSWTLGEEGALISGESVEGAVDFSLSTTRLPEAILFNCSSPEATTKALTILNKTFKKTLDGKNIKYGAYANAFPEGTTTDFDLESNTGMTLRKELTPEAYAAHARSWHEQGCQLIGGCCGIGPEHIAQIVNTVPIC